MFACLEFYILHCDHIVDEQTLPTYVTLQELMIQREKLERTEKNLDEINTTLRYSQKHINGIKVGD